MSLRVQSDIRSCGPLSRTGGQTNAQLREWLITWTGTKTWDGLMASLSLVWTWQLTDILSQRTPNSLCGHWPSAAGTVWGHGWRSRLLDQTQRVSTSSQETLWVLFLSALWSSDWTKNFYRGKLLQERKISFLPVWFLRYGDHHVLYGLLYMTNEPKYLLCSLLYTSDILYHRLFLRRESGGIGNQMQKCLKVTFF